MTSAIWRDVDADLDSMVLHFGNADELYRRGGLSERGFDDYFAVMALLHAMQSGYTSAEAALLRILSALREEAPTGSDWHQVLVRRLAAPMEGDFARPALLSPMLARALHEVRGFRHRAMHVYDDFNIELFAPAIEASRIVRHELPAQVREFRSTIDP